MNKISKTTEKAPEPRVASKSSSTSAKDVRQKALSEMRRSMVLDAARAVFVERGLEGTSIREIAQRAGYTPGAIYGYFTSKEEVYGALLEESLDRLNAKVEAAQAEGSQDAAIVLRRTAGAFFGFYRENPRDLDLGFYLFQGMQPRGLTPEINERLNRRLRDSLSHTEAAMVQLGMPQAEAQSEVTALFAHTVGLLVLSHTGRIRMFKRDSQGLFDTYLDRLVESASKR